MWLVVLVLLIPTTAFIPAIVGRTDCQLRGQFHATPEINDDVIDPFAKEQHQRNIIVLCSNVSQDVANGIFDVNNLPKGRLDVLARCITSSLWISNEIRADTNVFLMLGEHNVTIEVRGSSVRSLTPDERTIALYLQRSLWNKGIDKHELILGGQVDVPYTFANSTPQAQGTYMNPQSTPMSEEKRVRDMKKGREAMINRINTTHYGKSPLPGFILHQNDNLQDRLKQLITLPSGDNNDASVIYMLSENGDPLWDVLEAARIRHAREINNVQQSTTDSKPAITTTLILGNQLGYSEDDEKLLLGTPAVQEVSLGSLSLLTSQCITITHHYLDRFEQFEYTCV